MDIKRAEEILESKGIIEVTYNNSPVWLESVIPDNSTVHVKVLSSNRSINVPVEQLTESLPNKATW